jgi:hypothetical protein
MPNAFAHSGYIVGSLGTVIIGLLCVSFIFEFFCPILYSILEFPINFYIFIYL